MRGLERFELAHQAVVLGVRDVRFVEHVVAVVGVVESAAQFGYAIGIRPGHRPYRTVGAASAAICS